MALFRCTATGVQADGRQWSLRTHFASSSTTGQVEIDWLAQVTSAWTNGTHGIETLFPTATTLQTTKTEKLQVFTVGTVDKLRAIEFGLDNPALAGTSSNAALPDQNATLVSLLTGLPGKENRGRFRLPAIDETLVTTGVIGTTPATRVSTACNALRTGMGAAGHTMVVVTYKVTKIGTPVGSNRPITACETDRVVRTLRGRVKSKKAIYV